jgi:hypothetical protein
LKPEGPPHLTVGPADRAQADSRFATGVVHCIKGGAIAVAKHGITGAATAEICSACRMHAAEFQHSFTVSMPRVEQPQHGRAERNHRRRPSAGFTPALPYWRSSAQVSGGVQIPVEVSVPRTGQERRPFGLGER